MNTELTSCDIHSVQGIINRLTINSNHILLDIDETIFNPLNNWRILVQNALPVQFSVNDIEIAGSMDNYFLNTQIYDDFISVANELRRTNELYKNTPLIDGAKKAINTLAQHQQFVILGYLSARPISVLDVTINEIKKNKLPFAPVVLRDDRIDFYSSVEWKTNIVSRIVSLCKTKLIIIDDNYELMKSLSDKFKDNDKIICIYFKGPLSKYTIANNNIFQDRVKSFYIAGWDDIPKICINAVK